MCIRGTSEGVYSGNTSTITHGAQGCYESAGLGYSSFALGPDFSLRSLSMHSLLVALAFVAMVACPAIVAAMPQNDTEEEA